MSTKTPDFHQPDPPFQITIVSAGVKTPSRTRALAEVIVQEIASRVAISVTIVDLAEIGRQIAVLGSRNAAEPRLAASFLSVETAELLIAASPIYKASYTGIFKHFFDLFDVDALSGVPVLLAASGGSDRHALAIEHHFRPLFSFFGAPTLPTTVYALDQETIDPNQLPSALKARIARAASEAVRTLILGRVTDAAALRGIRQEALG